MQKNNANLMSGNITNSSCSLSLRNVNARFAQPGAGFTVYSTVQYRHEQRSDLRIEKPSIGKAHWNTLLIRGFATASENGGKRATT